MQLIQISETGFHFSTILLPNTCYLISGILRLLVLHRGRCSVHTTKHFLCAALGACWRSRSLGKASDLR